MSPSIREIAEAVGLSSSSTVFAHLTRLERDGAIKRERSRTRSITITGMDAVDVRALLAECLPHLPPELAGKVEAAL